MRRNLVLIIGSGLAALVLAVWGIWTWRLSDINRYLSLQLEAERQRNFNEMVHHVEQLQNLLGKGLATGVVRQNMRYLGDVYHHSQAAVANFTALPLPAEVSAQTGKFLQQTGDFAVTLLRNEAAGREMDAASRREMLRLRQHSFDLSTHLHALATEYNRTGEAHWNPPATFNWATLLGRHPAIRGKPTPQDQAPSSMVAGGWNQIGSSMEKLPVLLYDGPFSDHVAQRSPAMSGPAVTQEEATRRLRTYLPQAERYQSLGAVETGGPIPGYSFRLIPAGGQAAGADGTDHTMTVEIARNGGFLLQVLNGRLIGNPTLDMARARTIGEQYLASIGYTSMSPTYGQVDGNAATIVYAYRENGVIAYPDQIKVKVALDNGEIVAVDARQYLMSHHRRALPTPKITKQEAEEALNPDLEVQRVQLALIPDQAGTGEILTYEFLTGYEGDTFLVYLNAETGVEEQILQQVESDGGTFAL